MLLLKILRGATLLKLDSLKITLILMISAFCLPVFPLRAQETNPTSGKAIAVPPMTLRSLPAPKSAKIPLELMPSRHIAVSVSINGNGPFRMILDTGSPVTFVSNKTARKAGLLSSMETANPAQFGMRGQLLAKTLAVGEAQLTDFSILVLDHPIIEALNDLEGPIDGILGFSFWARYHIEIDYAAKTVTFLPGAYVPDDMLKSLMSKILNGKGSTRTLASSALFGMDIAPLDSVLKSGGAKSEEVEPGIIITRIYAGSAAAEAGLHIGDRLLELDGRWTDTVEDCIAAAAQAAPGQKIVLKVQRSGKTILMTVRPHLGL